jgi:hypothetical protein
MTQNQNSEPSVEVHFDVAAVIAEASVYGRLIVLGDADAAARFLIDGSVADIAPIVEALPHPLTGCEVVSLTVPNSGRSTTLTRFMGEGKPVLVLAVWIESGDRLGIREQRLAGV